MRKMKFHTLAFVKSLMRRDRHVFVSMTATGLDVALYELGFWGWREAAFASAPLGASISDLAAVESGLLTAIGAWNLPPQTDVSWVLPPDILGVVQNVKAVGDGPGLDQVFPFNRDDILMSKALNGRDLCSSILWVHKDWADAFQRVSQNAGLRCCELFARAQLFKMSMPMSNNVHCVLVDHIRGESFLHIFNGNREIVRSKSLGADSVISLDAAFEREMAAIRDDNARMYCVGATPKISQREKKVAASKPFTELPTKASSATLRDFALSLQQGVEIGSTDASVVKAIRLVSASAVSLVSIAFLLVIWQNYELQTQIVQGRASVRKDLAVYESAKTLRSEAVRFAKVIELKDQFTHQPESFKILANVLGTLGPNASIHFFSQDETDVRLAGGVDPSGKTIISLKNTTNFRNAREIDPRSLKEAPKATFAWHLVWNDPSTRLVAVPSKVVAP